jgi:hypothetical protein
MVSNVALFLIDKLLGTNEARHIALSRLSCFAKPNRNDRDAGR